MTNSAGKNNERKIETRKLDELITHPNQAYYFGDVPEEELATLAVDIEKNGLLQPVEVTGDGTIIAGHQRVRAAERLGWDAIAVWVRLDLEEQGQDAIKERLLADNLHRRQLSKLGQARVYRELKRIEARRDGERFGGDQRDAIGKRFGVSGRTLDRWSKILDTPSEVQHAIEADLLSMRDAGRIATLPSDEQRKLASEIRAGKDPKKLLAKYLPKKAPKRDVGRGVRGVVASLRQIPDEVDALRRAAKKGRRNDSFERHLSRDDVPTLRQISELCSELIAYIESHPEQCAPRATFAEVIAEIKQLRMAA